MSFTHPAALWALPLALAPLILHLLNLRRSRRVEFSDLTLLRAVEARSLPRRRLRSWLLAAVRSLLLALLALAWAGPVVSRGGPGAGEGEAGLGMVVLLDSSYSMGYRVHGKTRFEAARAAAERVVRGLGSADRVAVGVFSDRLELPAGPLRWAEGKAEALEVLSKATLSHRGTDVGAALTAAHGLLRPQGSSRGPRRVVLVLSDGARHGFRRGAPEPDPGTKVLGLVWDDEPANARLASVLPSPESSPVQPAVLARAAASGPAPRQTSAQLTSSGVRAGSAVLSFAGRAEDHAVLRLGPAADPRRPAWQGWVELTPDALSADDRYYFSLRHAPRPRVLCLSGSPDFFRVSRAGYFLKELFGSEKGSLLAYDGDFLDIGRAEEAALADYRAVILADFKDIPPKLRKALEERVRSGAGLWVLPGAATPDDALRELGGLMPAAVGSSVSPAGAFGLVPAADAVRSPEGARPADAGAVWKEFELQKVAVRRYRRLEPAAGARVLFRTSSGDPVLVTGSLGAGAVALWASPLDLEWTNLALKPVFAAWVEQVLDIVSRKAELKTSVLQVLVDEPIRLAWKEGEPLPDGVKVRSPLGKLTPLRPKNRAVAYGDTAVPGLYAVVEEGATARESVFAVNTDRAFEGDLSRQPDPPWESIRAGAVEEDLRGALFGRDARGQAFGGALALLIAEMLLAFPWRKNQGPPGLGRPRRSASSVARALVLLALALLAAAPCSAQSPAGPGPSDRFVWTQLKLGPDWDPYADAAKEALELFGKVTSVLVLPERRVLALDDEAVFESPLLILAGRSAPEPLSDDRLRTLRSFVAGGGMLWIEDVAGASSSSFDRWVRKTLAALLPEAELSALPPDHVVYKTFFFLRGPAGRAMVRPNIEGVVWGGRVAVLYSRNDLLGAWAKDALGRPLLNCTPGGEAQRHNARKLTLNIMMYSLTGSYKSDAVHQPYLLEKMRQ
ncbi:MAG: DUF4159 domain-containing protein [Elusimicrobia bacterium]|nr:DUF4159 domain-containing protein [Elusimicrobiota bacterium]